MNNNYIIINLRVCSYEYLHVLLAGQLWVSLPQRLNLVKCSAMTTARGGVAWACKTSMSMLSKQQQTEGMTAPPHL